MSRRRSRLTPLARILRQSDNLAEARLWLALRDRQQGDLKFRRQFPIGSYIADFACPARRLVVELDGGQHIDNPHDVIRDRYLCAHGWSVARFGAGDVLSDKGVVLDTILAICEGRISEPVESYEFRFYPARLEMTEATPHPDPLALQGEEGQDVSFMRRAIDLARAQLGRTWPNPPVGCVLVKDGVVIAEAATGDGGRPHAEEGALAIAGAAAGGATAYVTLEPCGERSTGTASCSQRLIEAGVARVVYACADPSPFAAHKGVQRMQAAGLHPDMGLLADAAAFLIAGFVHWLRTGQPLVVARADHIDALFTPISDDLDAELKAWGARGYRLLGVAPDGELAQRLRARGLLSE
ncbi:MAG TPA: DUF559 domain-containing protein [Asticcacaulis sp.]|nr:DUF559 domain-containing protein [Asticcacaulis sp.]